MQIYTGPYLILVSLTGPIPYLPLSPLPPVTNCELFHPPSPPPRRVIETSSSFTCHLPPWNHRPLSAVLRKELSFISTPTSVLGTVSQQSLSNIRPPGHIHVTNQVSLCSRKRAKRRPASTDPGKSAASAERRRSGNCRQPPTPSHHHNGDAQGVLGSDCSAFSIGGTFALRQ